LTPDQKQSLQNGLTHWITYYSSAGADIRVVRKLSTSLALFYIVTLDGLDTSVSNLVFRCAGLDATVQDSFTLRNLDRSVLQSLSRQSLSMIMWFITSFAEEGGKKNSSFTAAHYTKLNSLFSQTMRDIVYLLDFVLTDYDIPGEPESVVDSRTTAMSALSAAKYFYLNICTPSDDTVIEVKQCLAHAINWVDSSKSPDAIRELVELLNNDRIFDDSHYRVIEKILTTWGRDQLREDILNDMYSPDLDFEADEHVLALLLAYTDSRLANLLEGAAAGDDPSRERSPYGQTILGKNKHSRLWF